MHAGGVRDGSCEEQGHMERGGGHLVVAGEAVGLIVLEGMVLVGALQDLAEARCSKYTQRTVFELLPHLRRPA